MLKNNILELFDMGIEMHNLLKSNIFNYRFEYDEWPQVHTNLEKMLVPYNGSIFELRNRYDDVFSKLGDPLSKKNVNTKQMYKIQYSLNLLMDIKEKVDGEENSLIYMLEEKGQNELAVFEAKAISEILIFKW